MTTPPGVIAAERKPIRSAWFWWRLAVGIGLLVLLVRVVGLDTVLAAFGRARPGWALAVIALGGPWLCLGALNVWLLLRRLGPIPPRAFLSVYVTSWAASVLLPGQLGDVTQVTLLRRYGIEMSSSGAAYIVDKLISLGWLLAVGVLGIALYLPRTREWWLLGPPVLFVAALVGGLALLRDGPGPEPPGRVRRFLLRIGSNVRSFEAHRGALAQNLMLTAIKWIVMTAMYLLAFRVFGARISPASAATIPVIASLVGYVPITIGGAGTMEWTAVTLFGGLGVDQSTVVVAYLFLRAVLIGWALLLMLVVRELPR